MAILVGFTMTSVAAPVAADQFCIVGGMSGFVDAAGPWLDPREGDELSFGIAGDVHRYKLTDVEQGRMTRQLDDGTLQDLTLADLGMRVLRDEETRGVASVRLIADDQVQGFVWHDAVPYFVQSSGSCLVIDLAVVDDPGLAPQAAAPSAPTTTTAIVVTDPCTNAEPCPFWLAMHGDSYFCDADEWGGDELGAFRYAVSVSNTLAEAFKQSAVELRPGGMECPNYEPYGASTDAGDILDAFHSLWQSCQCTAANQIRHLLVARALDNNVGGLAHCRGQYGLAAKFSNIHNAAAMSMHEIGHNFDGTHAHVDVDNCGPRNAGRILLEAAHCAPSIEGSIDVNALLADCWSAIADQWPKVLVFTNGANTLDSCPDNGGPSLCNNAERIALEATRKSGGLIL